MGIFDRIKKTLSGGGATGTTAPDAHGYWVYAQCRRCGEPLRTRIDLRNDPSAEDDGTFAVRKGPARRRCYQVVEIQLHFSADRRQVLDQEIEGGRFINAEEYQALAQEPWPPVEEQETDA